MNRFVLMCAPRTGSTYVISTLIAAGVLPERKAVGTNYELFNPTHLESSVRRIESFAGRKITGTVDLIRGFYEEDVALRNGMSEFVGFKLFPNLLARSAARMGWQPESQGELDALFRELNIVVIGLHRRDMVSQVASFLMCLHMPPWDESSAEKNQKLVFDERAKHATRETTRRFVAELEFSKRRQDISLVYEDICEPYFASPELDTYFGRPIRFANARAPAEASSYVRNWDAFRSYVLEVASFEFRSAATYNPRQSR